MIPAEVTVEVLVIELILLARVATQPVAIPVDACATLVPPALSARITADLPGYSVANSNDAGEARVKEIASRGDWPCAFVVAGDFDGDGYLDRAMLIKSAQGKIKLISALNLSGEWQLSLSEEWAVPLTESELRPLQAGLYQRSDAIDHPVAQLDKLPSIQAENDGFSAGRINSRRAVYFFVHDRWQKLTIKDN
jgi:hypothetical protein